MRFHSSSSWRISEDTSQPLAVALHVRDALALPATKPFYVPPVVPAVPERIPVTGPLTDVALADEWALWFDDVLLSRRDYSGSEAVESALLALRSPAFRQAAKRWMEEAREAAAQFKRHSFEEFVQRNKEQGPTLTYLVQAIEKELGHTAAPFELGLKILPVDGEWVHQVDSGLVLMSQAIRFNPSALRRLLGPIIAELA